MIQRAPLHSPESILPLLEILSPLCEVGALPEVLLQLVSAPVKALIPNPVILPVWKTAAEPRA